MGEPNNPTVMIHWDATGMVRTGATDGVEVVYIDERAGVDRVYRSQGDCDHAFIESLATGQYRDVDDALAALADPSHPTTKPAGEGR